jgi:hypothetical protein
MGPGCHFVKESASLRIRLRLWWDVRALPGRSSGVSLVCLSGESLVNVIFGGVDLLVRSSLGSTAVKSQPCCQLPVTCLCSLHLLERKT